MATNNLLKMTTKFQNRINETQNYVSVSKIEIQVTFSVNRLYPYFQNKDFLNKILENLKKFYSATLLSRT